jgi:hypothetical protein
MAAKRGSGVKKVDPEQAPGQPGGTLWERSAAGETVHDYRETPVGVPGPHGYVRENAEAQALTERLNSHVDYLFRIAVAIEAQVLLELCKSKGFTKPRVDALNLALAQIGETYGADLR